MSPFPKTAIRSGARRAMAATIRAGSAAYDRAAVLPRLVPLDPALLADNSREASAAIVTALRRALRAERARGRAGHWTYDLNRHIGLVQALEAERGRFPPKRAPLLPQGQA